jgi:hypothetical protein
MRPMIFLLALLIVLAGAPAGAAESPALVAARTAYNAGDYDAAIAAATEARQQPPWDHAASLVLARAYLERFRRQADRADLDAAHEALVAVQAPELSPRDQVDLLVGLGQYLFLSDGFGGAAELFDSALAQSYLLSVQDRLLLLDWWANAVDRSAQNRPADRRSAVYERLVARMEEELRREPGSPAANYWLPVAARGAGNVERAWEAATAGWIRTRLAPSSATTVRADLDRFVTQALIPERVRMRGTRDPQAATTEMQAEWQRVKDMWP